MCWRCRVAVFNRVIREGLHKVKFELWERIMHK